MQRYYDYMLLTAKEHLTDIPEIPKSDEDEVQLVNDRLKVLQQYMESVKNKDEELEDEWDGDDIFDMYEDVSDKVH